MRRARFGERIAFLEATLPPLAAKVDEIHRDVKTLLAAYNRQRGAIHATKALYGGLIAGLTLLAKWTVDNWHSLMDLGRHP
jgi:hypothetical protein